MDDEWYIRNALTKLIRHLGYEVSAAKNGDEAIILFKEAQKLGANVVVSLDADGQHNTN